MSYSNRHSDAGRATVEVQRARQRVGCVWIGTRRGRQGSGGQRTAYYSEQWTVDGEWWTAFGGRWTVGGGKWMIDNKWRTADGEQWTGMVDGGRWKMDD